jgi:thiol-disulfide isomerase/thioredoxin
VKTPPALRLAYIGFAVIGLAVVTAYWVERGRDAAGATSGNRPASVTSDAKVPATQPQFTLSALDGKRHPIQEWSGHPQLVNFWATWCVPCRKEIPLLNQIQTEYAAKNLKIIGIAVDFPEDVKKFIEKTPLNYDLLVGEDDALEAARAYGVESMALPFSAFVDSHGRVLTVHLGELHERNLRATLDVLYRFDAGTLNAQEATEALEAANQAIAATATAPAH